MNNETNFQDYMIEFEKKSILKDHKYIELGDTFENPINDTIKDTKKEITKSNNRYSNAKKTYEETTFADGLEKLEAEENLADINELTVYWDEQLYSLLEMKIINLHKSYERTAIQIIEKAYKIDTYDFYKWETFKSFLTSKEIKFANLNGYIETNELRVISNFLKHENQKITPKVEKIKEFNGAESISTDSLEIFFNRIKPKVKLFIQELSKAICSEKFEYSTDRLKKIASELKSKMDNKTIQELTELLKK